MCVPSQCPVVRRMDATGRAEQNPTEMCHSGHTTHGNEQAELQPGGDSVQGMPVRRDQAEQSQAAKNEMASRVIEDLMEESMAFVELRDLSCGTFPPKNLSPPKPPPDRRRELEMARLEILRIENELKHIEIRRGAEKITLHDLFDVKNNNQVKLSKRKVRLKNKIGIEPKGKNRTIWLMQQEMKRMIVKSKPTVHAEVKQHSLEAAENEIAERFGPPKVEQQMV